MVDAGIEADLVHEKHISIDRTGMLDVSPRPLAHGEDLPIMKVSHGG